VLKEGHYFILSKLFATSCPLPHRINLTRIANRLVDIWKSSRKLQKDITQITLWLYWWFYPIHQCGVV